MFWVMVVVVAVVVFGTAAVAAGAGGTLGDTAGDPRPLADHEGPVQAADLAAVRFPVKLRGYRMDAVDSVLDRLGNELAARDARIEELEIALGVQPEIAAEPTAGAAEGVDLSRDLSADLEFPFQPDAPATEYRTES
ncbi:MAG TPA: DivIVA domain-containing protein [Sporichthya sp.]|nr:DivIVA domain-containing protein [Sporichthya sp.]